MNHRLPSGPAVIDQGALFVVGTEYRVTVPLVVTFPILLALPLSVNHKFPSGPVVIPLAWADDVRAYSLSVGPAANVVLGRDNKITDRQIIIEKQNFKIVLNFIDLFLINVVMVVKLNAYLLISLAYFNATDITT